MRENTKHVLHGPGAATECCCSKIFSSDYKILLTRQGQCHHHAGKHNKPRTRNNANISYRALSGASRQLPNSKTMLTLFSTSRICLIKCRIKGSGSPRNWFCFSSSYRLMLRSSNTRQRWSLNWKQSSSRTMFLVSLGSYLSFSCQGIKACAAGGFGNVVMRQQQSWSQSDHQRPQGKNLDVEISF